MRTKSIVFVMLLILAGAAAGCTKDSPLPSLQATAPAIAATAAASEMPQTVSPVPSATATAAPAATPIEPSKAAETATPTPAEVLTGDDYYVVEQNQRQGVVDLYGRQVLPCDFAKVSVLSFKEYDQANATYTQLGEPLLFAIPTRIKLTVDDQQYPGYLYDIHGKQLSDKAYQYAYSLDQNLIAVYDQSGKGMGAVDTAGREILPCSFGQVFLLGDRIVAATGKGDALSVYDRTGKLLKSLNAKNAYQSGDYVSAQDSNGKMGLLDKNLDWVIPAKYDDIIQVANDRFFVSSNGYFGVIDSKSRDIIPAKYQAIGPNWDASSPANTWFMAASPTGIALYDYNGKALFQNNQYDSLRYADGYFIAGKGNTRVVLDATGKNVLPGVTNVMGWLPKQKLFTAYDNATGMNHFYRPDGKQIPLPKFQYNECITADRFIARVDDSHCGICDSKGNWVVKPEYSAIYQNGADGTLIFSVGQNQSQLWGIMDVNGKVVLPAKYDYISGNGEDGRLLAVKSGDIKGLIDSSGKWIWYTSDYNELMD